MSKSLQKVSWWKRHFVRKKTVSWPVKSWCFGKISWRFPLNSRFLGEVTYRYLNWGTCPPPPRRRQRRPWQITKPTNTGRWIYRKLVSSDLLSNETRRHLNGGLGIRNQFVRRTKHIWLIWRHCVLNMIRRGQGKECLANVYDVAYVISMTTFDFTRGIVDDTIPETLTLPKETQKKPPGSARRN